MATKVLIVEDDPITARAFASAVSADPSMLVMASLGTKGEAVTWLASNSVDVCLVDLGLPDGSGLEVVNAAVRKSAPARCLVVTVFGDENNILAAFEAGASGYILKDALASSVASEIATLLNGGSPLSPSVATLVLSRFRQQEAKLKNMAKEEVPLPVDNEGIHLTNRESEVLGLIARGFSYQEVGSLLKMSPETVSTHLRNVYAKLSVHNRSEAVFEATRLGLLPK